jgi:hypothetical protein
MNSKSIYITLCESRKDRQCEYKPGSGLHRHHIVPTHSGGTDDPENITYLTVREHIIAHYLLWRINKNPNDLRSMHMLGAKLTPLQRKATGEFCRDNKLGFHGATPKQKCEWRKRGIETQKLSGDTNSFYWWSTPEGRRKRASMGGKATQQSGNAWNLSKASRDYRKQMATLGAKASPRKFATNDIITKKFYTDEERFEFITNNPDWRVGTHWNNGGAMKNKPSPNRKKVTDGNVIYNSVLEAAEKNSVTSGAIIGRCKSQKPKWSSWNYVS